MQHVAHDSAHARLLDARWRCFHRAVGALVVGVALVRLRRAVARHRSRAVKGAAYRARLALVGEVLSHNVVVDVPAHVWPDGQAPHELALTHLGAAFVLVHCALLVSLDAWPGGQTVHTFEVTYLVVAQATLEWRSHVWPDGQYVHWSFRT